MIRVFLPVIMMLTLWTCSQKPPVDDLVIPDSHKNQVRTQYNETVMKEPEKVLTGLDVLKKMEFKPLAGRSVGVVTNHTGLTRDKEHIVDLLYKAPEVELKAIFAPEHGFRGDVQAGDKIESGIDPKTQLPIYSLYGSTRQPTEEMIQGIDVLVFDIQDVGARFYTYISVMGYVLQTGAKYGIPVMILDRPNPIGRAIGGKVLDKGYESFVGLYPIPIRYGLTVGELAKMIIGEQMIEGIDSVELHVVECVGWTGTFWSQTDLDWTPTSPNMRNTNETLTYPGLCLLEGVGISEGRGTDHPFELIGTPYFDSNRIIQELRKSGLEGFVLEPAVFTPVDMPGVAMNPIYEGEIVQGFRITVSDPDKFKPIEFLIHLLVISKMEYPEQFEWRGGNGPDRLWGGSDLREMVDAGHSAQEIIDAYQAELADYQQIQQQYIIYK